MAVGGWTVEDCWAGNEHLTVSVCLLLTALCTARQSVHCGQYAAHSELSMS